ncbi:MAG: excinuclease ABC subunit UvrC [Candidatus Aminicenantales bacterium]
MREEFKAKLALLPDRPGVYIFKNIKNEILYVGKARSLKERVKSYFQPTSDGKVAAIAAEAADLDFVLTDSEREAAFLENNFVQRYQPKFNLRLKDDKSFPYLKVTVLESYPGVYLTRKVENDGARYFGPFSPAAQARKTIHLLNKHFGIRGCEEKVPGRRQRPCLEYDLNLCSAPCVNFISEDAYRQNVANALLFLEGKTDELIKNLEGLMNQAAQNLEYERAAYWRDLIRTVEQLRERPKLISVALEDADIFGMAREKKRIALYLFLMRRGKVKEKEERTFVVREETPDAEVLGESLKLIYGGRQDIPGRILLPVLPSKKVNLEEWLGRQSGHRVGIFVPRKGRDRKLVDLATRNAEFLLRKKSPEELALEALAQTLDLAAPPRRIEGFDVSTTGGEESVGAVVVFENGQPQKSDYRKYKIETARGPDDVASLREVIWRRYRRSLEEKQTLPDLVLVDGGKGQLRAAQMALEELGLESLPVVSLAKKEEIIFRRGKREGLRLERTSSALKLLQFIRDEAHRFAVTFHRYRREKKSFTSMLDTIPGIGRKRKRTLLTKFRSVDEIQAAALEELAALVGGKVARKLKEALDDQRNRD